MKLSASTIKRILDDEDVEGMLQAGGPPDEYESEAEMLAWRLCSVDASDDSAILRVIVDVCNRAFGPFDEQQLRARDDAYRRMARQISVALELERARRGL